MLGDDEKALQDRLKRDIMKELNMNAPQEDIQYSSLKDKLVDKIEKDPNLNQHEKDKMVFEHDKNLDQIEKELEKERIRQEQDLAALLREKADKRKKKLSGKDAELKERLMRNVEIEYDDKLKAELEALEKEIADREKEIYDKYRGDSGLLKEVKGEKDLRRKEIMARLEAERREAAMKALKDLEKGDTLDDDMIWHLITKFIPPEKMDKINTDFNSKKNDYQKQGAKDIERMKDKQAKELDHLLKTLKNMSDQDAGDMLASMVDKRIEDEYYDADPEDKSDNEKWKALMLDFIKGLDADLEKEALMDAWKNRVDELARILRNGVDDSDKRLNEKLGRRKNDRKKKKIEGLKLRHDEEEARLMLEQLNKENE